jgi:hypothetical protein
MAAAASRFEAVAVFLVAISRQQSAFSRVGELN